jgi:hypothetical protein
LLQYRFTRKKAAGVSLAVLRADHDNRPQVLSCYYLQGICVVEITKVRQYDISRYEADNAACQFDNPGARIGQSSDVSD